MREQLFPVWPGLGFQKKLPNPIKPPSAGASTSLACLMRPRRSKRARKATTAASKPPPEPPTVIPEADSSNDAEIERWRSGDLLNEDLASVYRFDAPRTSRPRANAPNPNYISDLGYKKHGIWKATPPQIAALGPDPKDLIREKDAPVGLVNLGATCYVNALVQTLFMNERFRQHLYQFDPKGHGADAKDNGLAILAELQKVFVHLQHSCQSAWDPTPLIKALGIKRNVQQDLQEFGKLLLSTLEKTLAKRSSSISPRAKRVPFVPTMFQGESANVTQCRTCGHVSRRASKFYELQVQVKSMRTVEEALSHFIRSESLDGQNQYLCAKCGVKRDADRRIALVRLPPVLNIQLMRTSYDLKDSRNRKIHSKIGIPVKIDMTPYLDRRVQPPPEMYDLKAIVLHSGTGANTGHYTAELWVDHGAGGKLWWKFDDKKISSLGKDVCAPVRRRAVAAVDGKAPTGTAGGGKDDDYVPDPPSKPASSSSAPRRRGRKRKKIEPDPTTPPESTAPQPPKTHRYSSDAYMLVYVRRGHANSREPVAPACLRDVSERENQEHQEQCEKYAEQHSAVSRAVARRKNAVTEFHTAATNTIAKGTEYCIVHADWLRRFMAGEDPTNKDASTAAAAGPTKSAVGGDEAKCAPCVNPLGGFSPGSLSSYSSKLLCKHGRLDPSKRDLMKRIPKSAFNVIIEELKEGGLCDDNDTTPLSAQNDMCLECCRAAKLSRLDKVNQDAQLDNLVHLLKAQPALPSSLNQRAGGDPVGAWASKAWIRLFKAYVTARKRQPVHAAADAPLFDKNDFLIQVPNSMTADLLCEHAQLVVGRAPKRVVTLTAFRKLSRLYPSVLLDTNTPECSVCADSKANSKKNRSEIRKRRRQQGKELKVLTRFATGRQSFPSARPPADGTYYIVPQDWATEWGTYIQSDSDYGPPSLSTRPLLCECGLLKYYPKPADFEMGTKPGRLAILPQEEYVKVKEQFGGCDNVAVKLVVRDGKEGWDAASVSTTPPTCAKCTRLRRFLEKEQSLSYVDGEISIEELAPNAPIPVPGKRKEATSSRGGRSRRKRRARTGTRHRFFVVASAIDTVGMLKLKVFEACDCMPNMQRLFFNGTELEDKQKQLREYEITDGCVLQLKRGDSVSECNFAGFLPDDDVPKSRGGSGGFGGSALVEMG